MGNRQQERSIHNNFSFGEDTHFKRKNYTEMRSARYKAFLFESHSSKGGFIQDCKSAFCLLPFAF